MVEDKTNEQNRTFKLVNFNLIDVEVIESVEPYPFPIATITIGYNSNEGTKWGVFAKSIASVFGHVPSIDELLGKKQEWAYLDCELRLPDDNNIWANREAKAWQLVSIDGVEGASGEPVVDVTERVLELVDGKSEQDFYQVLYTDEVVRGHPDIVTAATERKLLTTLMEAGKITRDTEGIYHKVI